MAGTLAGWLSMCLFVFVGWLSMCPFVCLSVWLAGWLADWLIVWLVDLTGWLTETVILKCG